MTKTILHVGCGRSPLPAWLEGYEEVRLDIDPDVQPDIIASITDLGDIGPFDGLYTSHTLEHLFPHEVATALSEFRRVVRPGGMVVVIVPDLEGVEATTETLYDSPAGPVCGLDMIYGMARLIAANPYMAHRCGFVHRTLSEVMGSTGFTAYDVRRDGAYNLVAGAVV